MMVFPMSFIWPSMLISLVFVPLLAAQYARLQRRRRQSMEKYDNLWLVQGAGSQAPGIRPPGIRRHIPPALFLAGLAILLIAMARPQAVVSLPRIEGTVLLAFDVSGSMAADDVKPSRMEAAKNAARAFVLSKPENVQAGVVAFSDNGFSIQSPTKDRNALIEAINRLEPERGTSLAHGILASLNVIAAGKGQLPQENEPGASDDRSAPQEVEEAPQDSSTIIVLITDGENTAPPDPLEAAQAAANRGVRIYTIGIGSVTGATINVEGFTVHTQLDEATLQQISQMTGGIYSRAENEEDLRAIYENLTPQLVIKEQNMEVTALFAGASLLILLLGGVFSWLWFNRLPV